MMYVVRRGFSYTDIHGRNRVYTQGQEFSGKVDPTQKWKLGELEPVTELPMSTKGVDNAEPPRKAEETKKAKTTKELDEEEMDAGEE